MSWTEILFEGGPSARAYHVAAWDGTNQAIWVHGGLGGSNGLAQRDLWRFHTMSETWELVADQIQSGPSRRYNHAAAWDETSRSLWIHGGYSGIVSLSDLWRFHVTTTSTTRTSSSLTTSISSTTSATSTRSTTSTSSGTSSSTSSSSITTSSRTWTSTSMTSSTTLSSSSTSSSTATTSSSTTSSASSTTSTTSSTTSQTTTTSSLSTSSSTVTTTSTTTLTSTTSSATFSSSTISRTTSTTTTTTFSSTSSSTVTITSTTYSSSTTLSTTSSSVTTSSSSTSSSTVTITSTTYSSSTTLSTTSSSVTTSSSSTSSSTVTITSTTYSSSTTLSTTSSSVTTSSSSTSSSTATTTSRSSTTSSTSSSKTRTFSSTSSISTTSSSTSSTVTRSTSTSSSVTETETSTSSSTRTSTTSTSSTTTTTTTTVPEDWTGILCIILGLANIVLLATCLYCAYCRLRDRSKKIVAPLPLPPIMPTQLLTDPSPPPLPPAIYINTEPLKAPPSPSSCPHRASKSHPSIAPIPGLYPQICEPVLHSLFPHVELDRDVLVEIPTIPFWPEVPEVQYDLASPRSRRFGKVPPCPQLDPHDDRTRVREIPMELCCFCSAPFHSTDIADETDSPARSYHPLASDASLRPLFMQLNPSPNGCYQPDAVPLPPPLFPWMDAEMDSASDVFIDISDLTCQAGPAAEAACKLLERPGGPKQERCKELPPSDSGQTVLETPIGCEQKFLCQEPQPLPDFAPQGLISSRAHVILDDLETDLPCLNLNRSERTNGRPVREIDMTPQLQHLPDEIVLLAASAMLRRSPMGKAPSLPQEQELSCTFTRKPQPVPETQIPPHLPPHPIYINTYPPLPPPHSSCDCPSHPHTTPPPDLHPQICEPETQDLVPRIEPAVDIYIDMDIPTPPPLPPEVPEVQHDLASPHSKWLGESPSSSIPRPHLDPPDATTRVHELPFQHCRFCAAPVFHLMQEPDSPAAPHHSPQKLCGSNRPLPFTATPPRVAHTLHVESQDHPPASSSASSASCCKDTSDADVSPPRPRLQWHGKIQLSS